MKARIIAATLSFTLGTAAAAEGACEIPWEVMAYIGMPAPISGGYVFTLFNNPLVGPDGRVAFYGRASAGGSTLRNDVYLYEPDDFTPLRRYSIAEGRPVLDFNIHYPTILNASDVGGSSIRYAGPPPTPTVAHAGDPVPGYPDLELISFYQPSMNEHGTVTFVALVTGGDEAVFRWSITDQQLELVLGEFESPPMAPLGAEIDDILELGLSIGPDGDIIVPVLLKVGTGGVTEDNDFILYEFRADSSVSAILLEGTDPPFDQFDKAYYRVAYNRNRHFAFAAGIHNVFGCTIIARDDEGIYILDFAPGGVSGGPDIIEDGRVIYEKNDSLYIGNRTGSAPIASAGDNALIPEEDTTIRTTGRFVAAARGNVVFSASLEGPGIHAGNNIALYSWNEIAGTTLLMRQGDFIELAPGDVRQIGEFHFTEGESHSGWGNSISDNGNFAMRAVLEDGTTVLLFLRTPWPPPGDFTGPAGVQDGTVDVDDLNALLASWQQTVTPGSPPDLNGDGVVDVDDLNIILADFGQCW